jgi:hypothetical protein
VSLGGTAPVETRPVATFIGAAVMVEVVALVLGTRSRGRFAVVSGLAIGTVGLGVEWVFNQQAHQPWTTALLPEAFVVGIPAAVGAALLGTAVAAAIPDSGDGAASATTIPAPAVTLAGVLVVVSLLAPLPREVGDVTVEVTLEETTPGRVVVHAELDPPGAADDARWFYAGSWQHGGRESAPMVAVADGVYRSDGDVAVDGWAKSLLRLHRGAEMMTVPIRLPADPEIGEPEIPAVDRAMAFEAETRYLLRETREGPPALAISVQVLFVVLLASWAVAFAIASSRIRGGSPAGRREAARVDRVTTSSR